MAPPLQGKDTWQCGQDRFLQWFYDQGQGDETWGAGLGSKASNFRGRCSARFHDQLYLEKLGSVPDHHGHTDATTKRVMGTFLPPSTHKSRAEGTLQRISGNDIMLKSPTAT